MKSIFCTDLDNTMIFSYKHDIGADKVNVERYQGREVSYVTRKTYQLLRQAAHKMLLVPVTTRTMEQYNRIDLGLGVLPYALVCNGGILLENGKENKHWYQQSLALVQGAFSQLQKALKILEYDQRRIFELRFINKLFVFTKCDDSEEVICKLKNSVDLNVVDVLNNGNKVYVVPKILQKGMAIKRLKKYIEEKNRCCAKEKRGCSIKSEKPYCIERKIILAAGDSAFDISMLQAADIAFAPKQLAEQYHLTDHVIVLPEKRPLSDEILEYIAAEYDNFMQFSC